MKIIENQTFDGPLRVTTANTLVRNCTVYPENIEEERKRILAAFQAGEPAAIVGPPAPR